jgi:hypothetical protein
MALSVPYKIGNAHQIPHEVNHQNAEVIAIARNRYYSKGPVA